MLAPPSGFIAGVYARDGHDRGVHKAPANEIDPLDPRVRARRSPSASRTSSTRGINVLRDFPDRGIRVWGARMLTSRPGVALRQRAPAVHL